MKASNLYCVLAGLWTTFAAIGDMCKIVHLSECMIITLYLMLVAIFFAIKEKE